MINFQKLYLKGRRSSPMEILAREPFAIKSEQERAKMTSSCHDCDYIPKVKLAGKLTRKDGEKAQVMHNGVLVVAEGYYGNWMSQIIKQLKGHHEPQEERVFYEILKRLDDGASMIELGSFWAYFSIWFSSSVDGAKNICAEPNPKHLEVGKLNAQLNGYRHIKFYQVASGEEDHEKLKLQPDDGPKNSYTTETRTVDSLMEEAGWDKLDLLHMDIQGAELGALRGAIKTIKAGKLRFVMISTHHYSFTGTPLTHQHCLDYIKEHGGHIISSHTVMESFSGDGLIAATFDKRDRDFKVEISLNHTDDSLFRPLEEDLAALMEEYRDIN